MSSEFNDLLNPEDGDLKLPRITTLKFTPDGCDREVDVQVGKFSDKALQMIGGVLVHNLLEVAKRQRMEAPDD